MTIRTLKNPPATIADVSRLITAAGGSVGSGGGVSLVINRFRAALAASQTNVGGVNRAAPIFFIGSSGTAQDNGSIANVSQKWTTRVTKALQAEYPLDSGLTPPAMVSAMPALPLSPGVQGINLGLSGGTSGTGVGGSTGPVISLTPGNARYAKDIGARNPAAVFIQWPTNDVTFNVPASTTYTNFKNAIYDSTNGILAGATRPICFIFWRQYQRWDTTSTIPYDDYLAAMNQLASEHPNEIMCLDLVPGFAELNIGNSAGSASDESNPYGFMYDVNVHLNAYGSAYQADVILSGLGFGARAGGAVSSGDITKPTIGTLSHSTVTSSSIQWLWTPATDDVGVAGYRLRDSTTHAQIGSDIASSATGRLETGLTANTPVSRYLTAFDAAGNESDPSNTDGATTLAGSSGYRAATDSNLIADIDPSLLALANGAAVSSVPILTGFEAGNALTQATTASQPTFKTNAINGLPALVFNGSSTRLLSGAFTTSYGPGFTTSPGPVTLFAVIKASAGDFINGTSSTSFLTARKTAATTINVYAGGTSPTFSGTDTNNLYEVVCIIWNGTSSRLYVNDHDTYVTGSTGTSSAAKMANLRIGSNSGGNGNFLNGEVARLLLVKGAVADADIGTEMLALGTDYGIAVA